MSKLLIVGSRRDQSGEEQNLKEYEDFFQEAGGSNVEANHAFLDDLLFDISADKFSIQDMANGPELDQYETIVIRGKLRQDFDAVFAVSRYCSLLGIKHFNDFSDVRSTSKLAQAVRFYESGLPFPRTVYSSPVILKKMIHDGQIDLPFIYKNTLGAHGNDNHLISSLDQLEAVAGWGMVAQPVIPNDSDYRVLIVGNQNLVIKRTAKKGSHLNNTSQGGSAEICDSFSPEILKQCQELAKVYNMVTVGIDVIFDKHSGKHYFLEVNPQPQLKSGAFIDQKKSLIRDYLLGP